MEMRSRDVPVFISVVSGMKLAILIDWIVHHIHAFYWLRKNSDWIEAFSAYMGWGLGILLLMPMQTMNDTNRYRCFLWVFPEATWGIFFLIIGILHSIAICIDLQWLRSPSCLIGGAIWVFVGSLLVMGDRTYDVAPWAWIILGIMVLLAGAVHESRR